MDAVNLLGISWFLYFIYLTVVLGIRIRRKTKLLAQLCLIVGLLFLILIPTWTIGYQDVSEVEGVVLSATRILSPNNDSAVLVVTYDITSYYNLLPITIPDLTLQLFIQTPLNDLIPVANQSFRGGLLFPFGHLSRTLTFNVSSPTVGNFTEKITTLYLDLPTSGPTDLVPVSSGFFTLYCDPGFYGEWDWSTNTLVSIVPGGPARCGG